MALFRRRPRKRHRLRRLLLLGGAAGAAIAYKNRKPGTGSGTAGSTGR